MEIGIIGAGGVGGYYGGLLARAGNAVRVLARGAHLDAMLRDGLEVRTPEERFRARVLATDDPESLAGVDLAIVAVKSYDLPGIVPAAHAAASAGGAVLPLLNGVEAADQLAEAGVPDENILGGVTYLSAVRTAPGVIERLSPFQRVLLGERGERGPSPRVEAIARAFRSAGVEATVSPSIEIELWRKLIFLAAISSACALVEGDMAAVRARPLGHLLVERLVREAAAVARADRVALPQGEERTALRLIESLPDGMRPSFLLDYLARGPNELDILSGAVARIGRRHALETPVHDAAITVLSRRG